MSIEQGTRPQLHAPPGATAKISIIDSTMSIRNEQLESKLLMPPLEDLRIIQPTTTWCFLIEQLSDGMGSGLENDAAPVGKRKKAVWDLGAPTHPDAVYSPQVLRDIADGGWEIGQDKSVADILKEGSVDPQEVDSVIWSHHHFDHIGDPNTFPKSTEIVVGTGFTKAHLPGYPTNPKSELRDDYFEGRKLHEVDFGSSMLEIGGFRAIDFFADGSFYLLDTPGHAVGHMSGLVRTTAAVAGDEEDTFIFLGGDICHHGGELHPSPQLPMPTAASAPPDEIPNEVLHAVAQVIASHGTCPGGQNPSSATSVLDMLRQLLRDLSTARGRGCSGDTEEQQPLFDTNLGHNLAQAMQTLRRTHASFDAADNVWCVFAHDMSLRGVVDAKGGLFPARDANHWKRRGWDRSTQWRSLRDLVSAVEAVAPKGNGTESN
ncbi:uncharacterized protein PG998_002921 [Apiospora kogelbergensis]|uniref:uncharacterized protein n=1 Tax=Apiospora kogelbergensis TaxID=1337665 RepID=UPI003131B2DF